MVNAGWLNRENSTKIIMSPQKWSLVSVAHFDIQGIQKLYKHFEVILCNKSENNYVKMWSWMYGSVLYSLEEKNDSFSELTS